MKKFFPYSLMVILILAIALSGCGGGKSGGSPTPGQSVTYTVGSGASAVSFKMSYAPSGSFPSDDATILGESTTNFPTTLTVASAYWIAETDVTYQLWYAVYTWATTGSGATGRGQYYFQNAGKEGSMGAIGAVPTANSQHPVTTVSWRDAMVWCNALTEYYNAQSNGTNLACVYTYGGTIVRDSRDSNATACDNVVVGGAAKGFRLPTSNEWELAARYQDGTNWTPGDHVSGDTSGYCYNSGISTTESTIFGNYAWYSGNCSSTKPVATTPQKNALGLYDVSGNVWQWCFDWYPGSSGSSRVWRGGFWGNAASNLQLGFVNDDDPVNAYNFLGFRPVRTQ